MLESLPFEGTIKVRNKGVDISILADAQTVDTAFAASRQLVVCGISTAVLEVTCLDPIDIRTLAYYEKTTPCMLAMTKELQHAVQHALISDVRIQTFEGDTVSQLVQAARDMVKKR